MDRGIDGCMDGYMNVLTFLCMTRSRVASSAPMICEKAGRSIVEGRRRRGDGANERQTTERMRTQTPVENGRHHQVGATKYIYKYIPAGSWSRADRQTSQPVCWAKLTLQTETTHL